MHLTARMAWHDNNWNGHICKVPENNTYCIGVHSLLSGRIEKKRNLDFERRKSEVSLSKLKKNEIPPCYWSINAFGKETFRIEQGHTFKTIKEIIPETVGPHSFYTWPFKLSFNHSKEKKIKEGNYPPDLEKRIENFSKKFVPKKSVVFFYANYDNPVSADEMKYLLIGCSLIDKEPKRTWFPLSDEQMESWKNRGVREEGKAKKMKNFPKINWALLCSHDPDSQVLLPYREYLEYVERYPEDEEKLKEMRVVIEEESLVRGFKYVAMDIDDDKCLYLLYKIRKAIKKIQEHHETVVKSDFLEEERRIDAFIKMVWKQRGIYPSLSKVFTYFLEDDKVAEKLAKACISFVDENNDLYTVLNNIDRGKLPKELKGYSEWFDELFEKRKFRKNIASIVKLSLMNLSCNQINKIIERDGLFNGLASNPYLLYEEYIADDDDLDNPDLTDEPIDIYKIDIGVLPDRKYVKRHKTVQNLSEDSPERVRSVIINYLGRIGAEGHCYDTIDAILDDISEYPLIYKNDITIDREAIKQPEEEYKSHFIEKLKNVLNNDTQYYYLTRIYKAENQIRNIISTLLKRDDHNAMNFDVEDHIKISVDLLKKKIPGFDEVQFKEERINLYNNVFRKSLYLITGKPGSGKTYETGRIVEVLRDAGESVHILAPTGKAVLRLRELIKRKEDNGTIIQTLDRFICERDYRWAYDDWDRLDGLAVKEKITIDNLLLDESSMIDLEKLKILMSIIRFDKQHPKRIIFIGDENQLPPIGFGKPFQDIINYIGSDEKLAANHYIHLQTNCRQENDQNIIKLASVFTDKRRYYEEALDIVNNEGQVSEGLFIYHWQNKDELTRQLYEAIDYISIIELEEELKHDTLNKIERLNRLFGLYKNGHVNNQNYKFYETLKLDNLQLMSPYRSGYSGVLGLNTAIQLEYRERKSEDDTRSFFHSDKIICLKNRYEWHGKPELVLSNGSIGTVKGSGDNRQYYFPEHNYPFVYLDDDDNYDLAYAITVHKSQGSDFRNVLLVIPNKLTLLSKELIYTALTRSRYRLFVFVQKADDNLFITARGISHLLSRHTSIFEEPEEKKRRYYPEKGGVGVQSKNEYIIYTALMRSGLSFKYEEPLRLKTLPFDIHPDFTITLPDNKTIYWEHLGMLDTRKYYRDWQERKKHYRENGLLDSVISTDDLGGLKDEKLQEVIDDLRDKKLRSSGDSRFSNHHYELY